MVLTFQEEKDLNELKQKQKLELLEIQHKYTMEELAKQLRIEAVKVYPIAITNRDERFKEELVRIVFDEHGREK